MWIIIFLMSILHNSLSKLSNCCNNLTERFFIEALAERSTSLTEYFSNA